MKSLFFCFLFLLFFEVKHNILDKFVDILMKVCFTMAKAYVETFNFIKFYDHNLNNEYKGHCVSVTILKENE